MNGGQIGQSSEMIWFMLQTQQIVWDIEGLKTRVETGRQIGWTRNIIRSVVGQRNFPFSDFHHVLELIISGVY